MDSAVHAANVGGVLMDRKGWLLRGRSRSRDIEAQFGQRPCHEFRGLRHPRQMQATEWTFLSQQFESALLRQRSSDILHCAQCSGARRVAQVQ